MILPNHPLVSEFRSVVPSSISSYTLRFVRVYCSRSGSGINAVAYYVNPNISLERLLLVRRVWSCGPDLLSFNAKIF